MVSKGIRYLLVGLALVALAVVLYDRTHIIRWVGSTELTVEFVVTNADTGQPIDGAEIVATNPENQRELPLRWKTDRDGVARWSGQTTCAGAQSGLRFTDTYSVRPSPWFVSVTAPGYQNLEPTWLYEVGGPVRPKAV